jgi:hypothetical protein
LKNIGRSTHACLQRIPGLIFVIQMCAVHKDLAEICARGIGHVSPMSGVRRSETVHVIDFPAGPEMLLGRYGEFGNPIDVPREAISQ